MSDQMHIVSHPHGMVDARGVLFGAPTVHSTVIQIQDMEDHKHLTIYYDEMEGDGPQQIQLLASHLRAIADLITSDNITVGAMVEDALKGFDPAAPEPIPHPNPEVWEKRAVWRQADDIDRAPNGDGWEPDPDHMTEGSGSTAFIVYWRRVKNA